MMRLDKYLSERTGMTRSESRKAITKGRVAVNGRSAARPILRWPRTPLWWWMAPRWPVPTRNMSISC